MPESVTDRPTKAHEYMFLLSKSQKYYYDTDAIREDHTSHYGPRKRGNANEVSYSMQNSTSKKTGMVANEYHEGGRNKRTVWTVATKPFAEAHFATFPPALIEPCILAGTSERGVCPECGKAWERQVEKSRTLDGEPCKTLPAMRDTDIFTPSGAQGVGHWRIGTVANTTGWLPSCHCSCDPVPAVVIDPFFGAGTTGLVAKKLGRRFIGIELNEAYIGMAQKRVAAVPARLDRWAEAGI
jgi:hypothetical protein